MSAYDWTPPPGMRPAAVASWRAFYRRAASGEAGYRISPAEYRRLYLAQQGRCFICRKARGIHPDDPNARGSRRLGVDHNHATGLVRGLLCTGGDKTCNRVIGWLDAVALQRAADYVRNPPGMVLQATAMAQQEAEAMGVQLTEDEMVELAKSWIEAYT